MLRSVLAILLGLAVIAVVIFLGLRFVGWILPAAISAGTLPRDSSLYLIAVAVVIMAAGVAGGLVTGSTAPRFPLRHARELAVIGLVWSALWIISRAVPATTEIMWYALAVGLCGALGALVGGRLQHRR